MTISYTAEVANASGFGCFTKILLKWGGSVYKLIYKELAAYLFLYFTINLIYRHWLCQQGMEEYRQFFESLKAYCALHINSIPMTFGLGFYVQLVVKRWWDQYNLLPWPDSLGLIVISLIHGIDEKSRLMRRNIMRYFLLSYVITLRRISLRVRKRFPTLDHVVEAGIMRADEKKYIESLDEKCSVSKWWLPLIWAGNIVKQARESNNIKSDPAVQTLLSELCQVRKGLTGVQHFDTISVPLVYTQVVTVAVYTYFGFALFGSQWVKPEDAKDFKAVYKLPAFEEFGKTNTEQHHPYQPFDLYLPFFLILQFIFYIGWLKVAETLINPFGEDDDDFELNYLIDRHVQVSYLIVDEKDEDRPKLEKDAFFDKPVPTELPYTEETAQYRREEPKGSAEVAEEIYNNSNIYYRMIIGGGSHGYGNNINTPTSGKHSRMGSRLIRRPQRTTMRKMSLSKPIGQQSTFIGNGSSTNPVLNHGTNGSALNHMNETVNATTVGATAAQNQANNHQPNQGISDWSGEESEYERIDPMTASSLNLFSWVKDRVRKSQMRSTHPNVHPSLSNLSNTEDSASGISGGPNYSNASRKTSRNKSQKFIKMFSNRKISKERLQRKESSNLQQQSAYVQNNKLYAIEGIDSSSSIQNNISTPDTLINNLTKADTLANKAPINTNLDVESGMVGRPQSAGLNKMFSPSTSSSPPPVAISPQPQNTPDKLLSPPSSLIDENELPGTTEEQRMMIIEKLRQLSPNYLSPITEVASPYNTNTNNSRRDSALPSVEAIFAITNPVMASAVTPTSPTSLTSSGSTAVYSSITTPPTHQGPTYPSLYTMAGSTMTTSVMQQPQPHIHQQPQSLQHHQQPQTLQHHQQLRLNTSLDVESSNYYPLAGSEHSGPVVSGPIATSAPLTTSSPSGSAEPRSQRFSVEEVPPYEPVMFRKPATVAEPLSMHGVLSDIHGHMHSLPAMTSSSGSLSAPEAVAVPEAYMSPALPKRQAVMSLKHVSSVEDHLASTTTTSEPMNTTTPVDVLVTRASSPENSDITKGEEVVQTEPESAFAHQNTYYV